LIEEQNGIFTVKPNR